MYAAGAERQGSVVSVIGLQVLPFAALLRPAPEQWPTPAVSRCNNPAAG